MTRVDQIDQLARRQARAATTSRRQGLRALVAGLVAVAVGGTIAPPVAAACRTRGEACNAGAKACCPGAGLRCQDGTCRCRHGHAACTDDGTCIDLAGTPAHCGACGKQCPPSKPCCIQGTCTPKCGEACCPNCFVELLAGDVVKPNSELCCVQSGGLICRPPGGARRDDLCCRPGEACLNGVCCAADLYGETQCDGKCCGQAACCNGTTCCPAGEVCARKPGAVKDSCVPADRTCAGPSDCFENEGCFAGECCKAPRTCFKTTLDEAFCCAANEYCEFIATPQAVCTLVGQTKATYRGNRVRP